MKTLSKKCVDSNTVESFCGCIADAEPVDKAARAFCDRAKTVKTVTDDDLAELKKSLLDMEECNETCC